MNWKKKRKLIGVFLRNIPDTLKKTFVWLIISYSIPLINIFIIWGIRGGSFPMDLNISSILLVTNACFITSLIYLIDRKREIANILSIVTNVIVVILFALSIVQLELKTTIFPPYLYEWGAIGTLILSIIFGLISKYDEVEALGKSRAEEARNTTQTTIDGNNISL